MVINDIPVQTEIKSGDKFSATSNVSLLTSLRTGKINNWSKEVTDNTYKGIKSTDIFTTYLSYNYFEEGSYDFRLEIVKGKDKVEGREYFKLEHQKDVWVMTSLWKQFQALLTEIEKVQPKLIIVTGKWTLFFLTGCTSLITNQGNHKDKKILGGLSKFRSSVLQLHECFGIKDVVLVPVWHTVHAMSMPDKLVVMQLDIEKLGWMYHNILDKGVEYYIRPAKEYVLGTTLDILGTFLHELLLKLNERPIKVSIDIETMYHSTIDCIGIAYEVDRGICVPFASRANPNLWSIEDEVEIIALIREVMLHPNCQHVGQNYSYDCQYFHKLWNIDVQATTDTMVLHHVLFNYLPKDLAFLASLYCETYTYWKDEVEGTRDTPETRWIYNAKDVMYTLEIANILEDILTQQPELLQNFYRSQQDLLAPALVDIMNRGVKVDLVKKQQLLDELSLLLVHIESTINTILGETINLKSSHQVKRLCTDLLQVVPVIDRKSKTASFGSEAMLVYLDNYPLYRPLITLILEYRSVGIFVRTFLSAKVDDDNRMRTSYNLAGTRTYRLASRKNAFGAGMNLQNVPAKGKIDLKYSLMRLDSETEVELEDDEDAVDIDTPVYGTTKLPNCKELFICEEDEMFFDIDLAAADARIIAWVSGCPFLTDLFEDEDGDPYLLLAREYYRNPNLTKKNNERQIFKAVVHGTNYLGQAKTLSAKAGLLVREIEKIQKFYFSLCPEIPALHRAIEQQVRERGYLENVWGARGWFLDKNDPMLMNKAVAWVGSSPVGILINKGLVSIREQDPAIKVLLQVHDSLAGVYKKDDVTAPDRIVKYCSVPLPFEIPRVIPVNIKTSPTSYGDCG
jgi:DNA polymerase I-like protein with 3'-5' exonuclease and polymerase domains